MKENNKHSGFDLQMKSRKNALKIIAIILFVLVIFLFIIIAPVIMNFEEENKEKFEEKKKEEIIEYPVEVTISEHDAKFFVEFFNNYAVGIQADINLLDDINQNEMIDFCRMVLSEKYLNSGVIPKNSMDDAIEEYFGLTNLNYTELGYDSLDVYKEYKADKVFNITKLMKQEKDSEIYLVYADCIDKSKVSEETYKKEDVEDKYMFTFEKVVQEIAETRSTNVRYILNKVEIDNNAT